MPSAHFFPGPDSAAAAVTATTAAAAAVTSATAAAAAESSLSAAEWMRREAMRSVSEQFGAALVGVRAG